MTTATLPVVSVDPEARAYAERIGMTPAFDHMLEVTPRLVPGLRSLLVRLKPDIDEPGRPNLLWQIQLDPVSHGVALGIFDSWDREFLAVAPRPREVSFLLTLVEDEA